MDTREFAKALPLTDEEYVEYVDCPCRVAISICAVAFIHLLLLIQYDTVLLMLMLMLLLRGRYDRLCNTEKPQVDALVVHDQHTDKDMQNYSP